MKPKQMSQNRLTTIHIIFFLTILLAISVGLQNGYAHQASLQGVSLSSTGKPAAPSVCSPVGFSNNSYPVRDGPYDAGVGDFNGDGKSDLAVANYYPGNISVLLGNGNGTFLSSTEYPAGNNPVSVIVADLFGDRIDDLVVVNSFTLGVSYLQGAGDGTFFPPYGFVMGSEPYAGAVGDFNSDGWPDLMTVSGSANSVSVRLNDGIGGFEPATHVAVSLTPFEAAIADLNGDGKPDIVTANSGSDNVSVLLGNGNGTFMPPVNFGAGDSPYAVAIGDFNSDAKPDLAVANRLSDDVSILVGNGDGLFQAAVDFTSDDSPFDVAIGDFNDDGKLDVVTANSGSNNVSVLLGNGNGTLQPPLYFSAGTAPNTVTLGDFNSDSKLDVITANFGSDSVSVLLNTCVSVANTPTPMATSTGNPTPLPTQAPGGPTATPQTCSVQFTDVPSTSTFYPFVRCLACRGIIGGYACGAPGEPCNPQNDPYFRPGNPVTRGQLAKIVSNSAGFSDTPTGQSFEDVPPGSTFYLFSERLASRSVMSGYACGGLGEPCNSGNLPYFRPGSGATRGQLTKIVSNAASFSDPAPATYTFTDVQAGSTFHPYVERLLLNRPGVMGGYNCGGPGEPCDTQSRPYFRPSNPLTRGQTSKIVANTFFPNCQTP